ncbi:BadF/BadG/BcrA/BcrD ATPase family protein [Fervidobacterium islandicum]|uniref:BadF/BadG/BcrA/BcrD ATPase family protein n=1 Tax=Fervidobacterium islandicum TaxID=2423 RepID=UPI003A6B3334
MSKLVLSIDGGGTTTKFCLLESQNNKIVYESIVEYGLNLTATTIKQQLIVLNEIKNRINHFFETQNDISTVICSVSGAGNEKRKKNFENLVRAVFKVHVIVLSDIEALRFLLLREKPGIIVICGTGSIAISHNGTRVGGWGHLFGDEAGAFRIVLEIIERYCDYIDGIHDYDPVFDSLKFFYGFSSPYELTNLQLRKDFKSKIASFASSIPLTDLTKHVIESQVNRFTLKVRQLAKKENIKDIYLFGGMFKNEYFKNTFQQKLEDFNTEVVDKKLHVELALNVKFFAEEPH